MLRASLIAVWCMCAVVAGAQVGAEDTVVTVLQLGDVVIRPNASGVPYEGFIRQVMEDTTFYHAFLNTKYHAHAVVGDMRVRNKDERETASLHRRGRLVRNGPMAELVLDSVREQGKLREKNGTFRYLTAEMYDDVFWPKKAYRASNFIASRRQEIMRTSKFDKYKSELKKFMFNPGQEIASVPFIGDKLDIYDSTMVKHYHYTIASELMGGRPCWVFSAVVRDSIGRKAADEDDTVIKRMFTWFDQETMMVMARAYRIQRASLLLDFDISIEVRNALVQGDLVPLSVRYDGDWDIPFKKRELVRFDLLFSDWVVEE